MAQSKTINHTSLSGLRGRLASTLEDSQGFASFDAGTWGWLPGLSVISALGLLIVAVANTKARFESSWAVPLFWLGLLILYVPIVAHLTSVRATRHERIGLVLILALGLYLIKVLHSPIAFTFGDEFAHWRTADDIIQTQRLFASNPLLPVSAFYPGLEIVTAALVQLSGMSIFQAGVVVLFVARIVLTLSLFLFFERASHSARVAGVASVLYTANPNYVFWSSQFSYESLALPLAALVVLAMAILVRVTEKKERVGLDVAVIIIVLAIVPTHHMTSYALIVFLTLWVLVVVVKKLDLDLVNRLSAPVRRWVAQLTKSSQWFRKFFQQLLTPDQRVMDFPGTSNERPPIWLLILTLSVTGIWLVSVASLTVGYLAPVLSGAITEFATLIAGESAPKEVFRAIPGRETPLWERLMAFGAIGLLLLGLPFGWLQLWRWRRSNVIALVLATAVLAYPVTLAMRLTEKGTETSNRSSEFLFVAISFVVTLGVLDIWLTLRPSLARQFLAVAYLTAIFIGGVVVGFAPWTRMPGPYQVGGDTRALQPQSEQAAAWMLQSLGPGNRVISDGTNRILMGSYGRQSMVSGASWLFFSPKVGSEELAALERKQIQYLVVDRRLSTAVPVNGTYFESGEPGAGDHASPIELLVLEKFDFVRGMSRLFDSGDIVIYDVTCRFCKP